MKLRARYSLRVWCLTGLYRRAVSLLGDQGLTDLTVVIGYFTCVSLSLRAYDVASNATGLRR
jgi:4-carboxymuconolactone decarboxylase